MDRQIHEQVVSQVVSDAMAGLFPHGAGLPGPTRVKAALDRVAKIAFNQGRLYALTSLLTAEDVAEHFGISRRRARALIKNRHERLGVGYQVPGTSQWLVSPEELESLAPDVKYRVK
jgi:hypothetical protein